MIKWDEKQYRSTKEIQRKRIAKKKKTRRKKWWKDCGRR